MAKTALAFNGFDEGSEFFEFAEHEQHRVDGLKRLLKELRAYSPEKERSDFSRLFSLAQTVLELDDAELARMLHISRPTVSRWANGDSAPHPLGRTSVFQLLADVSDTKLKRHGLARRALRVVT